MSYIKSMNKKLFFTVLFSLFILTNSFVFTEDFTFNGIKFGSQKSSFAETSKLNIGELKFKDISYSYENNVLTEVSAELSGGTYSMARLANLIAILKNKYNAHLNTYNQNGGDIIQLCDANYNLITILISEVDNEDCEVKLGNAKIVFTSNLSKASDIMQNF